MKKSLLVLSLLGCVAAFGQLAISTNITTQFQQVATTNTILQGQMFNSFADTLAIGQQLGNMTNAAGVKLFPAAYFTNRDFTLNFSIEDTNSMVPNWIWISVMPGLIGQ